MSRYVCIHGHFYQPPREDPRTGSIAEQPSAAPFPNWNHRIAHECYRSNGRAAILDSHGDVQHRLNNYGFISFNFGPTLLNWLANHHPVILDQIRLADRDSYARFGKGSAIDQPYHHPILPLYLEM